MSKRRTRISLSDPSVFASIEFFFVYLNKTDRIFALVDNEREQGLVLGDSPLAAFGFHFVVCRSPSVVRVQGTALHCISAWKKAGAMVQHRDFALTLHPFRFCAFFFCSPGCSFPCFVFLQPSHLFLFLHSRLFSSSPLSPPLFPSAYLLSHSSTLPLFLPTVHSPLPFFSLLTSSFSSIRQNHSPDSSLYVGIRSLPAYSCGGATFRTPDPVDSFLRRILHCAAAILNIQY